jgi:hypothetical protein
MIRLLITKKCIFFCIFAIMILISLSFLGLLNSCVTYMSPFISTYQFFVCLILFCFMCIQSKYLNMQQSSEDILEELKIQSVSF